MYDEFAHLWPLISLAEDYATEARYWRDVLRAKLGPGRHAILELGVGGGCNLSHLAAEFQATAVDLSPKMLDHCRGLSGLDCAQQRGRAPSAAAPNVERRTSNAERRRMDPVTPDTRHAFEPTRWFKRPSQGAMVHGPQLQRSRDVQFWYSVGSAARAAEAVGVVADARVEEARAVLVPGR
jgi:SAM-dependent methyltransferase